MTSLKIVACMFIGLALAGSAPQPNDPAPGLVQVFTPTSREPAGAILQALAAMRRLRPDQQVTLILTEGDYGLEKELHLPDRCTISGVGSVTLYPVAPTPTGTSGILVWPGNDCLIQGIRIATAPTLFTPTNLYYWNAMFGVKGVDRNNVQVVNCSFEMGVDPNTPPGPKDDVKFSAGYFSNVKFQSCSFEAAQRMNVSIATFSNSSQGAEHIRFFDCWFTDASYWCVDLEPTSSSCPSIRDVIFSHCVVDARSATGGAVSISLNTRDVTFRDSHFYGGSNRQIRVVSENDCAAPLCGILQNNVVVRECYSDGVRARIHQNCSNIDIGPDGSRLIVTNSCGF